MKSFIETNGKNIFNRISSLSQSQKKLLATLTVVSTIYTVNKITGKRKEKSTSNEIVTSKKKVSLDKNFFKQFKFLLKIVLPGIKSKEFLILVLHTLFLGSRTFLSIFIAKLDGRLVKTIVDRNGKKFLYFLMIWIGVAIPATYVNSMIKYLESKLAIAFRTRLVDYSYKLYMENESYYRVGNLDSRLTNADQCLTEDVSKFCNFLAHLYSQISKPILDVALISYQFFIASRKPGSSSFIPFLLCVVVIYTTARVLKMIQPPFGKLAATQQKLEGDLRYVHSRLITHSEEIAFYGGEKLEEVSLRKKYTQLIKHMNNIFKIRILYNMFEGFFMKYIWSACGLLMIAIPSFLYDTKKQSVSTRTRDYVTSRQLLVSGAEAIERIMLSFKEVNELAGYTANVYEMISVFKDVGKGKYEKDMIKGVDGEKKKDIRLNRGLVFESDYIEYKDVPIVSPNGDVLVEKMNFKIEPGEHLLITGPNGCGKSSLFRTLGGLWPIYGGVVSKPSPSQMFYIPQRPYLSLGTLRDQVIYPDSHEDMIKKGFTDDDLWDLLGWVNLQYVVKREGGWDSTNDWQDVLSGGEKQRIGMARLFYHKPMYAILDECTSAVSIDVEGKMYQHAIDLGITLITVTHRPSLWKYHKRLLQFDGQGNVTFTELDATQRVSYKEEKSKLEQLLAEYPKMKKRLRTLCDLLGEKSVILDESDEISEDNVRDIIDEESKTIEEEDINAQTTDE